MSEIKYQLLFRACCDDEAFSSVTSDVFTTSDGGVEGKYFVTSYANAEVLSKRLQSPVSSYTKILQTSILEDKIKPENKIPISDDGEIETIFIPEQDLGYLTKPIIIQDNLAQRYGRNKIKN